MLVMKKFQIFKKNKESGQGLVEYAIVLPIFLMLVFFIIDYSTVLYDKVAFNMALREAVFDIDFKDDQLEDYLREVLNPIGPVASRYATGYSDKYREGQKRGVDFYIDHSFIGGMTLGEYLKNEIKKRDNSIDIDKIEFLDFEPGRESRVGIYPGLQYYHYKTDKELDGLGYSSTPNFSTIVVARIRAVYKIEPKGAFMKGLYPDGIPHEKVIYKTSRNFRWRPRVINPSEGDQLDSLKRTEGSN